MVFIVMPLFSRNNAHWALAWYQPHNLEELVRRFTVDPTITRYYSLLLKSFGFLPILGLPWLVLLAPELVINVLSTHPEMQSIQYHYTSVMIPVLMIASIYGAHYVSLLVGKAYRRKALYALTAFALIIVARTNYHYSPLPTTQSCWCRVYMVSPEDIAFEKVLQTIPIDASVTASSEIHAHVTHRVDSYMVPHAVETADYIALINQSRVVDGYGPKLYEAELVRRLKRERNYNIVYQTQHFLLYKRIKAL
jgi:uncharacterized membrane protein